MLVNIVVVDPKTPFSLAIALSIGESELSLDCSTLPVPYNAES